MFKFLFRTVVVLLVLAGLVLAYGLLLPAGPTQEKLVQLKQVLLRAASQLTWPMPESSVANMRSWRGITCMDANR